MACNNPAGNPKIFRDSTKTSKEELKPSDTLDDLFCINDAEQLKRIYGNKNVRTTRIVSMEDEYYLGTILYENTPDEVIIQWKDTTNLSKVSSVRLACMYDQKSEKYIVDSKWFTRCGIVLGMPLTSVVELNGVDFMFYGLGWDYGGGISDWKGGNLANKNIYVTLGVDDMTPEQEKQYLKILGDKEYSSANTAARNLDPMVFEIILSGK